MTKTKQVEVALLGCGKLGQGLFQLWKYKRLKILEQSGIDINIKHILVKHIKYKRDPDIPQELITDSFDKIFDDQSIKIVIDVMGGIEPTFGIIKKFLNRGCHVVSANRALLASKMREVFELARSNKVHLQFDAALGGGIPIIRTLRRDLIASHIISMWGVVSGTSNFILTEMLNNKKPIKEILKSQELQNLAESHMLIDYEGSDSAQKLALLAAMVYGVEVDYLKVFAEGISKVKLADIRVAEEFGYQIKLLAILKDKDEGLELRVHPTFVPKKHPINSAQDDYNAYYIHTDIMGKFMLYGKGAGIYPASNMIIRDLIEVATSIKTASKYMYELPLWKDKPVLPISKIQSKYYVRVNCLDVPGVFGKIASSLGNHTINIDSIQSSVNETIKRERTSFIHIFTEVATEKNVKAAISEIKKLNVVRGDITIYRILGEDEDVTSNIKT